MSEIVKLDYSRPPSDYLVAGNADAPQVLAGLAASSRDGGWAVRCPDGSCVAAGSWDDAVAFCWARFKAENDPPGIRTTWSDGDAVTVLPLSVLEERRATAWAKYDQRLALSLTHRAAWPDCLGWDDGFCAEMAEGPSAEEAQRQSEEHNALTLDLLDYRRPPPGSDVGEAAGSPLDVAWSRHEIDAAWAQHKIKRNPPGMWCGFARAPSDMENCRLRVGVSACGARWELHPDLGEVLYKGWLARARAWAWTWHDRRNALTWALLRSKDALASVGVDIKFHIILCWSDEWVTSAETWVEVSTCPGCAITKPLPDAFTTLRQRMAPVCHVCNRQVGDSECYCEGLQPPIGGGG